MKPLGGLDVLGVPKRQIFKKNLIFVLKIINANPVFLSKHEENTISPPVIVKYNLIFYTIFFYYVLGVDRSPVKRHCGTNPSGEFSIILKEPEQGKNFTV